MYLFDLNMSKHSLKSVVKGVHKNFAGLTGKQLCAGVSFIMSVQGA